MAFRVVRLVFLFAVFENVRAQCNSTECSKGYFTDPVVLSPDKDCYVDQESITITCTGDLGGPPFNKCLGSTTGTWQYAASTCELFNCARPVTGTALSLVPDKATYQAREMVSYSCTQGYTLTGADSAICDAQNVWNPSTVPVCLQACEIPVIINGNLTSNGPFNNGDTAQVQCYPGHTLESGASSTITCNSGAWNTIPQCYAQCTVVGVMNSDQPSSQIINHGSSITINCDSETSYNLETSFSVSCEDGTTTGVIPDKCYNDCPVITPDPNGAVTGGNLHGEYVEYTCDRGFNTNATAETSDTCADGTWNNKGVAPTCWGLSPEDSIILYCEPDKFIVEIPGSLLGDNPGVNSIILGSCSGSYWDGLYLYANSSYTECDTTSEVDNTLRQILYSNTVISTTGTELVTTEESLALDIQCVFDQDNFVSSTAIVQNRLSQALDGSGQYEMTFDAFTDKTYTDPITAGDRVNTEDTIYLRAEVSYVSKIDVYPTRCYATPEPASDHHQYQDLISAGCPVATYASDLRADTSTNQNFAFSLVVFRFTGSGSDAIYIHCELMICPLPSDGGASDCPLPDQNTCASPSARRRRASQITISKHVSAGPIVVRSDADTDSDSGDGGWEVTLLTMYSITVSALLFSVIAIITAIVIYRKRNRPTKPYTNQTGKI